MPDLVFRSFNEATRRAIPTVVAVRTGTTEFCIGEPAKTIASLGYPVVQNFKRNIGDSDLAFTGTRSDSLWPIRPGIPGRAGSLSTKEACRLFLSQLIGEIGALPKQLIIGIPTIGDENWQRLYKTHLSSVLTELGLAEPKFFPEPFAVFQYYRHSEKLIPDADHTQTILVIDAGGGTFDCCAIQTTVLGNLARKGSTANPLGVRSAPIAGKDIDKWLFELGLSKLKIPLLKKEIAGSRLRSHPYALFVVEQMKIELSDEIHRRACSLADDCGAISVSRPVPQGMYHPDLAFTLTLTGEDLKSVVLGAWKDHWGKTLLSTLDDVKYRRGKVAIDTIDKVILAGGSSHLAFVPQLVAKTLAGQINFDSTDIVVGPHFDKAVAYGLAIEAREQRNTALRTNNSIGPCIFNSLYLRMASDRGANFVQPIVRKVGSEEPQPDGILVSGPMEIGNRSLEFEVTLPFKPQKAIVFKFFDTPVTADDNVSSIPLNLENDIVRVPHNCPLTFHLKVTFGEDGVVTPTFRFGSDDVPGREFFFGGLHISNEVESYAGIDFGTSNTYVVNLWAEAVVRDREYPEFSISESAGKQLRDLEIRIADAKVRNLLVASTIQDIAARQRTGFIFNSIKIEGSGLSKGETEQALSGEVQVSTKELREPVNVADGYDFVLANASSYRESPELFLREINRIVLRDISTSAGGYRKAAVRLAGMDFEPPQAIAVPPYIERFARELREGPGSKSSVHFAAEAHAKLTAIHPFEDGNGRTARLLINAVLMDAGLCPITIEFTDKERYLDCLKASNAGDLSPLCSLLSELLHEQLDSLLDVAPEENLPAVQEVQIGHPASPSQRLADAVRRKVAAHVVEREARYRAWSAAFDSLRQEMAVAAGAINESFRTAPYSIRVTMYDSLPMDKYETILRGVRTPRTWLAGCEFRGPSKRETFVFFFQGLSHTFVAAARTAGIRLAERDVSLTLSRWSDGIFRRLLDEPVALREIAYSDGQLAFLQMPAPSSVEVTTSPISDMINGFFADVVESYL